MSKHHYVYRSFEEGGRDYIGIRSCNCLPEEDAKYFGSFKDKTFSPTEKIILFVCETRQEVAEIEIELHDFFDVAVNPQFANRAKAKSTGFDRTGFTGENHPLFGVPRTEETKKKISVANTGKTRTEETKKNMSEAQSGRIISEAHKKTISEANTRRTGALNPCSKAIIAIKPDGIELHFGGVREAARELGISWSSLSNRYLKTGNSPTQGKFKGWQFLYKNSAEGVGSVSRTPKPLLSE
jgi:hypothetical protein